MPVRRPWNITPMRSLISNSSSRSVEMTMTASPRAALAMIRADVAFWDRDRAFAPDLEAIRLRVERGDFTAFASL